MENLTKPTPTTKEELASRLSHLREELIALEEGAFNLDCPRMEQALSSARSTVARARRQESLY